MKTAISIPDDVFEAAEGLAEELGMSRSELYARAVGEYVARRRAKEVTSKLNEVYSKAEACLDPVLDALQRASLGGGRW
jgi:metal-responsive CopG/Arc/MetJ family transcriptional regulator